MNWITMFFGGLLVVLGILLIALGASEARGWYYTVGSASVNGVSLLWPTAIEVGPFATREQCETARAVTAEKSAVSQCFARGVWGSTRWNGPAAAGTVTGGN